MATTTREIDIKEFARDVERLCDFFLSKVSDEGDRNGSADLKVIEDIKELAANLQFGTVGMTTEILDGLSVYMKGVNSL